MVGSQMNWKGYDRKWLWPIQGNTLVICLEEENNKKSSLGIAGAPIKI
jgi:hypothetical protein